MIMLGILGDMVYYGSWLMILVISYFVGGYFYKFLNLENTAHWKKFAVGFIITLIFLILLLLLFR